MRAPTGTRVERTEVMALKAVDVIKKDVRGPENVDITTAYIGVQPASYPVNTIFLFTSRCTHSKNRPKRRGLRSRRSKTWKNT